MIVICIFLLLFILELNLQSFANIKVYFSLRYIPQGPCYDERVERNGPLVLHKDCTTGIPPLLSALQFCCRDPKAVWSTAAPAPNRASIMVPHIDHLLINTFSSFPIKMAPEILAQGNYAGLKQEGIREDSRRQNIFKSSPSQRAYY